MPKLTPTGQSLTSEGIVRSSLINATLAENYKLMPDKTIIAPKTAFIDLIVGATGCTRKSVYNWINGENTPNEEYQEDISKLLGISSDVLFPQN